MRYSIIVPDLDLPGVPLTISLWLVAEGQSVKQGERIVELLAGDVTVDLPCPADGILAEILIGEDEAIIAGDVLGIVDEGLPAD